MNKLTLLVHGESGAGKSTLADTAPGPRLIIDVEGGVRFTGSRKVLWDPRGTQPPPEVGADESVVVQAFDVDTVRKTYAWLTQAPHTFRSVIIDSLTELQKREVDSIAGTRQLSMQDFGALKRSVETLVRSFRDLTMTTVDVVVFVCGTAEKGQDHPVMRPDLQGKLAEQLGYYVDIMTFLSIELGPDGEPERRALFAQVDGIAAKSRPKGLGVSMDAPTIPKMLEAAYGVQPHTVHGNDVTDDPGIGEE